MNLDNLGGLLWLLAIGVFFYWMMRKGGCGMHAGHGQGGGHQHGGESMGGSGVSGGRESHGVKTVRDPVCGMSIEPGGAAGTRFALAARSTFALRTVSRNSIANPKGTHELRLKTNLRPWHDG